MKFGSVPAASPSAASVEAPPARAVAILGSTGSIGTQALDVVEHCAALRAEDGPDATPELTVTALAAGAGNLPLLAAQAARHRPGVVATSGTADDAERLRTLIAAEVGAGTGAAYAPVILHGPEAAAAVAAEAPGDTVLNGITGSIGLAPTLAALNAGKRLALANKESLIAGGRLVQEAVAASPLEQPLIPVDSEHSALAQALASGADREVSRLVVTASGGPFRGRGREELRDVTPREALAHPTWDMGLVVTTNSATMVNKALEVLEAHLLFGVDLDRIVVAVHPQSMVHSLVEFVDGSTIAQVSPPDMRLPIALGLTWPHRVAGIASGCAWDAPQDWTFEPLDEEAFPAVRMLKEAARAGGTGPAVFNAANEQAVAAFHAGTIRFTEIVETVGAVLAEHPGSGAHTPDEDLSVEAVLRAERWARERTDELLGVRA
ncbi:1-deoxy-D-xylulose-5-phosphate reductoisomerase [Rothia sp. AR01]|uniref:1-deoxy-D-xylulose 5-phosphate reductoisomerase n=1 Tax=Rothia santali TaxID=2949643 RepID=A0A9X2HDY2_9MICC|nr:1-deoxy-D-xylulose-5-phosphate reductoisomerase [Rothia santali]MCP3425072.1 1-deoxy-D-xylulose-5-phosphate reductoisomerase [Rothia santali]